MSSARQIFEQILKKRGISDPDSFMNPPYELGDPMLLPDIEPALKRIKFALKNNQPILVYGDYDIDGLTATTVLLKTFRGIGANIDAYIPDRFTDGYGLSADAIKRIAKTGVKLIITVDTGSVANEEISLAKSLGVDVIVTDHHTPKRALPQDAVAIVNPKVENNNYPYTELAGVGVAFTLVRAMQKAGIGPKEGQEKWLLDLVALGTVCDIVPLTGENRTLVFYGLQVLANTRNPGLRAMAQAIGLDISKASTQDLGFKIGPRLNASGRLTHAKSSLQVLSSDAADQDIVGELEELNRQRRSQQDEILEEALTQLEEQENKSVPIFVGENWNHGVVGIVASKLVERLKKPVFVLAKEGSLLKGSARSFGDFHLAKALQASAEHIEKGGGHAYAAGVTLSEGELPFFSEILEEFHETTVKTDQSKFLSKSGDIKLNRFDGVDHELVKLLDGLRPFGNSFEEPLFEFEGILVENYKFVGKKANHLQIGLIDSGNNRMRAIAFNAEGVELEKGQTIDIVAELNLNHFNGRDYLQLMVREFR